MHSKLALAAVSALALGGFAIGDEAPTRGARLDYQIVLTTECSEELVTRVSVGMDLRISVQVRDDLVIALGRATECLAADFDCDGLVNGTDLAVMLGAWGTCDGCPSDLNHDGEVGPVDLGALLGEWCG